MKIAYLILAHRNPNLIKKMIQTLSCDDCSFFLHIDRKSNIGDFSSIKGENIFFTNTRIPVYWAEYSMVEAILILIHQALNDPGNYDFYVLLSGSDYPLRSKEYIHNFLDKRLGTEFISMVKVPNEEAGVPVHKINKLNIPPNRPIYKFIVRLLTKIGLARRDYRKYLGNLEPYGGTTWWALTRDACQYILDFVKNNQAICRYFEKTFTSDETFFHTILGNSRFKPRIHRCLMYDDWFACPDHLLNNKHLAFFEAQEEVSVKDAFGPGELLFARKFCDDNLELVQRIDEMIKRKDHEKQAASQRQKAILDP